MRQRRPRLLRDRCRVPEGRRRLQRGPREERRQRPELVEQRGLQVGEGPSGYPLGMEVVIAGGHGAIARRLTRLLTERGDDVRGLIRNPKHEDDLRADGAEPVFIDIETASCEQVALQIEGADAAVFAAGAGPGSGPERKLTVDRDGAI